MSNIIEDEKELNVLMSEDKDLIVRYVSIQRTIALLGSVLEICQVQKETVTDLTEEMLLAINE